MPAEAPLSPTPQHTPIEHIPIPLYLLINTSGPVLLKDRGQEMGNAVSPGNGAEVAFPRCITARDDLLAGSTAGLVHQLLPWVLQYSRKAYPLSLSHLAH